MRITERIADFTTSAVASVLGVFSPYKAAQYTLARKTWKQLRQRSSLGGYDGAARKGANQGWHPYNRSADAEMRYDATRVLARARDLARNNDYVSGAIETIVTNIVGPGIAPQPIVKRRHGGPNKLFNEAADDLFSRWADACGFFETQELVLKHLKIDGEVLVHYTMAEDRSLTVPPLRLQLLECDQLAEYLDGVMIGGNIIKRGVELDRFNSPIAYHVLDYHPGETYIWLGPWSPYTARRIPASELLHIFQKDRITQTRGISFLAQVIMRMFDLNEYQDFEMVGAKLAAAFGVFIKSGFPETLTPPMLADATAGDGVSKLEYIEPGRIEHLMPGEEIQVAENKRPGSNYDPFVKATLRGAAVGVGLSYESFSGDYSNATYSSARSALLEERRKYRAAQRLICRQFNIPVWKEFIKQAVLFGMLPAPGYAADPTQYETVKWHLPGWEWVDPAKDTASYTNEVGMGINSRTDICASKGKDWEETALQLAAEEKLAKELGIDIWPSRKTERITETSTDVGVPAGSEGAGETVTTKTKGNGKGNSDGLPTQ